MGGIASGHWSAVGAQLYGATGAVLPALATVRRMGYTQREM